MGKLDLLKAELERKRKQLNDKGYHYDGNADNYESLMNAKPFEIAYQDAIEKIWPNNAWWEVTRYWDIFDAMMGGLSDEAVIDEIIKHVGKDYIDECKDTFIRGAHVEKGHNIKEYLEKFGDAYNDGILWDYLKEDFEDGRVDARKDIVYWYMEDLSGEWRYFETSTLNEAKEESKLDEGTSNFGAGPTNFPLLAFYTYDEVLNAMNYDQSAPSEHDFEDDDGNVDDAAYEKARDEWEQDYWDNLKVTALDEDDVERLEERIYAFNEESKDMARDADVNADGEQEYGPNLNLEDVKVKIEPGYYEAAYIEVEHEDYLDDLEDEFRAQQMQRFNAFFDDIKKEFHLTKLSAGPMASNGERFYNIEKDEEPKEESLEEAKEESIHLDKYEITDEDSDEQKEDAKIMPHGEVTKSQWEKFLHDAKWPYWLDWEQLKHENEHIDENVYDGKKGGNKGKVKTKVHMHFAADPAKNAAFFNHAMGSDKGGASVEQSSVSLGEGYVGQEVEDFLRLIVDPEMIDEVVISNIDADDYNEAYKGSYDELEDEHRDLMHCEYADFDVGGAVLVVNVAWDEDADEWSDVYYDTLESLLEDYNGDEVKIVDVNSGEVLFEGDKGDIDEELNNTTFISIDTPKYLCVNAHCGEVEEDDDFEDDIGLKIEYWMDEESRDQGLSDLYFDNIEDIEEGKEIVRKMVDRHGYASAELQDGSGRVIFGYDGVDTWGDEKDESLKEEVTTTKDGDEIDMFDTYKEAHDYLEKYAKEHNIEHYDIVEDNYEVPNGLLFIEYDEKGEEKGHYPLVAYKNKTTTESCDEKLTKKQIDKNVKRNLAYLKWKNDREGGGDKKEEMTEDGDVYALYLKVIDSNTGKINKIERIFVGSKKECDAKKKQLEDASPEDANHNKNTYKVSKVK